MKRAVQSSVCRRGALCLVATAIISSVGACEGTIESTGGVKPRPRSNPPRANPGMQSPAGPSGANPNGGGQPGDPGPVGGGPIDPAAPPPIATVLPTGDCAALSGLQVTRDVDHLAGGSETTVRVEFRDGVPPAGRSFTACLAVNDTQGKPMAVRIGARAVARGHTLLLVDPGSTLAENKASRDLASAIVRSRPAGESVGVFRWGAEVSQVATFSGDRAFAEARIGVGLVPTAMQLPIAGALEKVAATLFNVGGFGEDSLRSIVVVSPRDVRGVSRASVSGVFSHLLLWVVGRDSDDLTREIPAGLRFSTAGAPTLAPVVAALGQRLEAYRNQAHYVIGRCGEGIRQSAEIVAAGALKTPLTFRESLAENRGGTCDLTAILAGKRPYTRRIDLTFTPEQARLASAAFVGHADFTMSMKLSPDHKPAPAIAHYRGNGSYGCARRNYAVHLEGKSPRFILPGSATNKFFLISNCLDNYYLRGMTMYQLMAAEGLFPAKLDFTELYVDGVTRGVYTLMENPTDAMLRTFSGVSGVIRRAQSSGLEVGEAKWSVVSDAMALGTYQNFLAALRPLQGPALTTALDARMNVDQYLTWVALVNLAGSGDYIDEIYFVGNETTGPDGRPAEMYSFVAWDQDDILTPCHGRGRNQFPDPNGLVTCAESDLDKKIFADRTLYGRYTRILAALAERLTRERFEAAMLGTMNMLLPFFQNPATLAAMTDMEKLAPGSTSSFAAARSTLMTQATANVAAFDMTRRQLLSRLAAYRP